MAFFEGTPDEFYKFIGPRTSDIVTKLARPKRKEQKSCGRKNEDGQPCRNHARLDAAHLKGNTRREIIERILKDFGKHGSKKGTYEIDLDVFEEKFERAHDDFFKVINFMCRKHHKAYDMKNKIENDEDDYKEIEEEKIENDIINFGSDTKEVKSFLIEKLEYLTNKNCVAARISDENWNFNPKVSQLDKDCYLLCFNQFEQYVIVLKIEAKTINPELVKKEKSDRTSLNIPYSESEFIEKKTGTVLEYIETVGL